MSKNTEPTPATPTSLSDELLRAAAYGTGMGERIARTAAWGNGAYAVGLGLMIAAFLLATKYVFPIGDVVLDLVIVGGYGIGVLLLVTWIHRRRRASRPGWSARYAAGFAITMGFYAIGVALANPTEPSSLAFWIPYALLTATPLIVAALAPGTAKSGGR